MTITNKTYKKLENIVGKSYCSKDHEDLVCYAYDATARSYLPSAVVFPGNAKEISAILHLANSERFSVIPRGSGTGMTGGSLPVEGGIVLVMGRFNRILEIDKDNLIAHVEPGVVTGRFHRAVEKEQLFYPVRDIELIFALLNPGSTLRRPSKRLCSCTKWTKI